MKLLKIMNKYQKRQGFPCRFITILLNSSFRDMPVFSAKDPENKVG